MILESSGTLKFPDRLSAEADLSAIACINHALIIGGDEGHAVELLTFQEHPIYQLQQSLTLVQDLNQKEVDIEDICCIGSTCYVVGSHSRKRKKVDPQDHSQEENRKRLYQTPKPEPTREVLFQLTLNPKTEQLSIKRQMSLSEIIKDNKLLKQFMELPSKENGIDIEGLAIKGDRLYIGFRSPVLRGNYVPILSVDAEDLGHPDLGFIQMDGRGVRAMAETQEGFLIIGGPPGDGEQSYQLYFWQGNDMIPGHDLGPIPPLQTLGEIPIPPAGKAEGLALLSETDQQWQVLIVYDGIVGGNPTVFNVDK